MWYDLIIKEPQEPCAGETEPDLTQSPGAEPERGREMPIRTCLLDNGNFVCSPELPAKRAFVEYLDYADRLLAQWRKVQDEWSRSPFSFELGRQKAELGQAVAGFVETFKARYAVESVEQAPTYLPVSRFFAEYHPLREPFSILHCDQEMPLHTVHRFETHDDLARVNGALNEDTPFPWWQAGPHDRPCYLFGQWVWELRPSETVLSDAGIVLAFLDVSERHRQKRDRLTHGGAETAATTDADFVPEKMRSLVWRRAGGKCEKCGGHEGLDFEHVAPAGKGGNRALESVQLLCSRCSRARSGAI